MEITKRVYTVLDLIKIPFKASPVTAFVVAFGKITFALVPTFIIATLSGFINTATGILQNGDSYSLIYKPLLLYAGVIAYNYLINIIVNLAQANLNMKMFEVFRTAITTKRARLAYPHVENSETYELIKRVSKEPGDRIANGYSELLGLVSLIVRVGGVMLVLITQLWWAALIIIAFSVPLFYLAMLSGKTNYEADKEAQKYDRRVDYLTEVLTSKESVEERTLFGYTDRLNKDWSEKYETARIIRFKMVLKNFIRMKTASSLTGIISVAVSFVLLGPTVRGQLSLGMFIALVNATYGLVQMMSWELTYVTDRFANNREYFKDLTAFAALDETEGALDSPEKERVVVESIEFRDVRFKYPGTDKYILDGLSLKMTKQQNYAFVGINGAGKTTITKLLTGLYKDFEGNILINGVSIALFTEAQLKSMFSVVYQDFARYFVTLGQNIALGNVNQMDDQETVCSAVKEIGLSDELSRLANGLDTPLGKIKEGGQELSGGQWQRVALARSIVSPVSVRILDEPTAALDPISESRLYTDFERISKSAMTILISHRLGSTRLSDEIFVISNGRVAEAGSHDKLMKLGGQYKEMFESQRSWYESGVTA